jgi:predicted heme/steroid binding protein
MPPLYVAQPANMPVHTFTRQELANYDGRDGAPAYIAYLGQVHDVSRSYHWRNGDHWVRHQAGGDLTASLAQAPHGAENLKPFPVVGILSDESNDGPPPIARLDLPG